MKISLFLLVPMFFITSLGYSQIVQQQATSTQVRVVNQREYADKLPAELIETKPNTMNLDEVKGFVLVRINHGNGKSGVRQMIKTFKEQFSDTPFKLIDGTRKKQSYSEGYIYITQSSYRIDNNNYNTTWIFRDHNKRTVFAFNTVNIGVTTALSRIGITTY